MKSRSRPGNDEVLVQITAAFAEQIMPFIPETALLKRQVTILSESV